MTWCAVAGQHRSHTWCDEMSPCRCSNLPVTNQCMTRADINRWLVQRWRGLASLKPHETHHGDAKKSRRVSQTLQTCREANPSCKRCGTVSNPGILYITTQPTSRCCCMPETSMKNKWNASKSNRFAENQPVFRIILNPQNPCQCRVVSLCR